VLFEASSSLSTSVIWGVAEGLEIREKKAVTCSTWKRMAAGLLHPVRWPPACVS